jgi:hypothetical protein
MSRVSTAANRTEDFSFKNTYFSKRVEIKKFTANQGFSHHATKPKINVG